MHKLAVLENMIFYKPILPANFSWTFLHCLVQDKVVVGTLLGH